MDKTKRKINGYSLVELLVAMAMIALISTISIANFRANERKKRVVFAADGITNALRNAQNYTLTSRQIATSNCIQGTSVDRAAVAYRVEFSRNSPTYTLRAEDKCGTSHTIETYTLPQQVQFNLITGLQMTVGGSTTNHSQVQVKFTPPFARMFGATTLGAGASFNAGFQGINFIIHHSSNTTITKTVIIDGISGKIGE